MLKKIALLILIFILSIPLAIAVTLFTFPLWRWFEAMTGIEAYGHSGPAQWCYLLVYGLIVAVFCVFRYLNTSNKQQL